MSSSSAVTCGPHSLISVYVPPVGSMTAVEVRDSSSMRTKSLRIASAVNSSTMRVPVRPPARPVATTGTASRLSARATLIHFPPASVSAALARWRWLSWKFGTVSVRSIAALSVTVAITLSRYPAPRVVGRPAHVPARAPEEPRLTDRTRGDERPPDDEAATRVDPHLPQCLTLVHRQRDYPRRDHPLDERPVDTHYPPDGSGRDERECAATVLRPRGRVHAAVGDEVDDAVTRDRPREQRGEIAVPSLPRLAAEQRRVDRHVVRPRGRDLGPARPRRVAGLDPEGPREAAEQVVPGVQDPAAADRRGRPPDDRADHRSPHRDPRQPGDVPGARVVTRLIEAVRVREVGVAEPELPRLRVHHRHEPGLAAPDVLGERDRGVVRTLDQRRLDELSNGQLVARLEEDRRLAHARRRAADGDDVVELRVLQRDEDRHQLRDARDRQPLARVARGEDLPSCGVLDEVGARVDVRRGRRRRRREQQRERREREPELHAAQGSYL